MKLGYFVRPHIGGTYTVFKQLREGLSAFGIEVCWIAMGECETQDDPEWSMDYTFGTTVTIANLATELDQAKALADVLDTGGYDGVFINVLSDRVQTNIARYLPEKILRILIVHNITAGTYAAAVAVRDHVHAAIGVSERIRSDLVDIFGFPANRTVAIPHAADTRASKHLQRTTRASTALRVIFLGRIEDASKGVFWLPEIVEKLGNSIHLTVAGDGPDLAGLRSKLSSWSEYVTFLGAVHPKQITNLLLQQDVLVMPSRFEGFGLTLIEAMAAGCIPVVSRIHGVTVTIVDDGRTGFLFTIGNAAQAAQIIGRIAADPHSAKQMSIAAKQKVESDFTLEIMGKRYSQVIQQLSEDRPSIAKPLALDDWSFPRGLRSGLRTYVPRPVKNWLRVMRERYRHTPFGSFS
jgi:glycosyltransferase involved in cell wall biosynthesis